MPSISSAFEFCLVFSIKFHFAPGLQDASFDDDGGGSSGTGDASSHSIFVPGLVAILAAVCIS